MYIEHETSPNVTAGETLARKNFFKSGGVRGPHSEPCLLPPPPPAGPVVYALDLADRLISKAGPFAAAGIMVGSIYWTAVTYGAVTVMQVGAVCFWFMRPVG